MCSTSPQYPCAFLRQGAWTLSLPRFAAASTTCFSTSGRSCRPADPCALVSETQAGQADPSRSHTHIVISGEHKASLNGCKGLRLHSCAVLTCVNTLQHCEEGNKLIASWPESHGSGGCAAGHAVRGSAAEMECPAAG